MQKFTGFSHDIRSHQSTFIFDGFVITYKLNQFNKTAKSDFYKKKYLQSLNYQTKPSKVRLLKDEYILLVMFVLLPKRFYFLTISFDWINPTEKHKAIVLRRSRSYRENSLYFFNFGDCLYKGRVFLGNTLRNTGCAFFCVDYDIVIGSGRRINLNISGAVVSSLFSAQIEEYSRENKHI